MNFLMRSLPIMAAYHRERQRLLTLQSAQIYASGLFIASAIGLFDDGRHWPARRRSLYREMEITQ